MLVPSPHSSWELQEERFEALVRQRPLGARLRERFPEAAIPNEWIPLIERAESLLQRVLAGDGSLV